MRTVAVVTGTRAEFGLLSGVLDALAARPRIRVRLVVTGQHLMPEFGLTVGEVERSGHPVAARVPMPLRRDDGAGVADALGRGVSGLGRALARLRPDLLVLLGDRFETLAAASAALPLRIPVAHLHGGEATEGAIDEQVRHAVTKLSHLHFVAAEPFRRRLLRMGEDPRRVFRFGAPGLDGIGRFGRVPESELRRFLGAPDGLPLGAVTYHPETLSAVSVRAAARGLARALSRRRDVFWVWTMPGAEAGWRAVVEEARAFVRRSPGRAVLAASLGRERYLSLLRRAAVVVGNSSSGLLEAPSFGVPTVNVGERQRGRLRAASVLDCAGDAASIGRALSRALTPAFAARARRAVNPYAGRDACRRIARVLATVPLGATLLKKSFREGA